MSDVVKRDLYGLIDKELEAANQKFPLFNSTHEAFAVILEEAEEAKEEAETAGFEPACPKGANAFRVRLVMTTSIRLRKVWQLSAAFAERIRNLRCSSRDLRDRCSILVRRARIRNLRCSFAGFAL